MANHTKPDALKAKARTFSCRDDEYEYVKKQDQTNGGSFKRGLQYLMELSGYKADLKKILKKKEKVNG